MTAGERPSSRSQDPDVRPQGIDYCLGVVMDVRAVHRGSKSVQRNGYFSFRDSGSELWNMDIGFISLLSAPLAAFSENSPSLSVRHHRRDGFTVSHNTRQSTSKLALDAQLGGRSSIYGATSSVVVASGGWDRRGMSDRHTMEVRLLCLWTDNCQLALASKLASQNRPSCKWAVSVGAGHQCYLSPVRHRDRVSCRLLARFAATTWLAE